MLILKLIGFTFLSVRFSYWVGSSLESPSKHQGNVLLSQTVEGLLLFVIFAQLIGRVWVLPMKQNMFVLFMGFLLTSVGVGGSFVAKQQLGESWIRAGAARPSKKLVTTGIYKYVRHPIYLFVLLSYVGIELLAGSWLWVSVLFFVIPAYLQARKEEIMLGKKFKKHYIDYLRTSKMFVPGVW